MHVLLLLHLLLLQLWPWLHLPLLHRCLLLLPNVLTLLLQLWPRLLLLLLLRRHRQRLLRKEGRHVLGRSRGVSRALEGWDDTRRPTLACNSLAAAFADLTPGWPRWWRQRWTW